MEKGRELKNALVEVAIAFDIKQEGKAAKNPRAHYNRYAIGQYLRRIDDVIIDIENGAAIEDAIVASFTIGPLRNALLKGVGFKPNANEASGNYLGMPVYRPVKARAEGSGE